MLAATLIWFAAIFAVSYAATKGIIFLWNYDTKAVLAERAKTWRNHSQDWQHRSE